MHGSGDSVSGNASGAQLDRAKKRACGKSQNRLTKYMIVCRRMAS